MPATLPDLTNAETWTDADLDALRVAVVTEQERRYVLATAEARAEQTARQYRDAVEAALPPLAEGEHRKWVQPTRGIGYPKGARVTNLGQVHESTVPNNVWTPDPSDPGYPHAWKIVTPTNPATGAPAEVPFSAGIDAKAGVTIVTHDGHRWRAKLAHVTHLGWVPSAATHAVWEDLGPIK